MGKFLDWLLDRKTENVEIQVNSKVYKTTKVPNISDAELERLDIDLKNIQRENKIWERNFAVAMEYQGNGQQLEKNGDAEAAAVEYERAVEFGENCGTLSINNYLHSLERLCIIYRKLHRPEDELRVIDKIIDEVQWDKTKQVYQDRREKVLAIIEKLK